LLLLVFLPDPVFQAYTGKGDRGDNVMNRFLKITAIGVALVVSACASEPVTSASDSAMAASGEPEIHANESGAIVYDKAARRECIKRARTGTRIPRDSCKKSMFPMGYHQTEGHGKEPAIQGVN